MEYRLSQAPKKLDYYQQSKHPEVDQEKFSPDRIDLSQYDKIRVVGKGAFGIATVCRKRRDCSLVVLKEIDLKKLPTEGERLFAINEANIMSMIDHVNIIRYYNTYQFDSKLIIEMEYANNGTLSDYLSIQTQLLEEQEILIIFRQISIGLEYLHSNNIIHQDLKTANIFLSADGLVKIGDFGIARLLPLNNLTTSTTATTHEQQSYHTRSDQTSATTEMAKQRVETKDADNADNNKHIRDTNHYPDYDGARVKSTFVNQLYATYAGTPAYCSPEKCLGEPIDRKSDIWSLGCILYELITLKQTFEGSSLPAMINKITKIQYPPIKRSISTGLRTILEQMLTKDPMKRPQASEIVAFIKQILYKIQVDRYRINNLRSNYRLDFSTVVAALAANDSNELDQVRRPHSLVYQVRLDQEHITVDRLNLPKTKRFKEIAKGSNHYLALTHDNIVYGWGDRTKGQLGVCSLLTAKRHSSSDINVKSSSATTSRSTLAYRTSNVSCDSKTAISGQLHLRGDNNKSVIDNRFRDALPAIRPFILNDLSGRKITQVAAGNEFSVFLSRTGLVLSCGSGSAGCLGHGDLEDCSTPTLVKSLMSTDVISISCGIEHVVAVCGDGKALAWGNNKDGRLGIDNSNCNVIYVCSPRPVIMPHNVFIKKAICGDQSTIFIDSESNCWACGTNTFNKLGLDERKRFKGARIVERQAIPAPLTALGSKQKAVSCSIGKHHSGVLLDDGKLLILGKDIDLKYSTYERYKAGKHFYPKTISSLLDMSTSNHGRSHFTNQSRSDASQNNGTLSHSTTTNKSARVPIKQSLIDTTADTNQDQQSHKSGVETTAKQRRIYKEYIKKSRSTKKILNSSVVKVACTSKFTLALTSDNRVYFWGTRSHSYQPTTFEAFSNKLMQQRLQQSDLKSYETITNTTFPSSSNSNVPSNTMRSIETQLVASCTDDCIMKIGATNDSLMATIEKIGSDQPIIQVQDPKLIAKSFSDLWILDYNCDEDSVNQDKKHVHSSSKLCNYITKKRHDVILEPQSIVGLYVPSVFKQNGHTICMSDIFCFDEDKFFIIFDSTVAPHSNHHLHGQKQHSHSPGSSKKQDNFQNGQNRRSILRNMSKSMNQEAINGKQQLNKTTVDKNKIDKIHRRQAIVTAGFSKDPSKDKKSKIGEDLNSTVSKSSTATLLLNTNKNVVPPKIIYNNEHDISPSEETLCHSKPIIQLNNDSIEEDFEYQQASFDMGLDDEENMMKNDDLLTPPRCPSLSSSIDKTGSTVLSCLGSRPDSPVSLNTLNSNIGSKSVSSTNTTDNTIVSDDHQSLAYEEPFSLSNIAHMTSTRYEFIKSASSSDLSSPQTHQSSDNLAMIRGIYNNMNDNYNAQSKSLMKRRSLVLSHSYIDQLNGNIFAANRSSEHNDKNMSKLWNHCNSQTEKGDFVSRSKRIRRRTTTNSSYINRDEVSNETETYDDQNYDDEHTIDEDSIPEWVRNELDQNIESKMKQNLLEHVSISSSTEHQTLSSSTHGIANFQRFRSKGMTDLDSIEDLHERLGQSFSLDESTLIASQCCIENSNERLRQAKSSSSRQVTVGEAKPSSESSPLSILKEVNHLPGWTKLKRNHSKPSSDYAIVESSSYSTHAQSATYIRNSRGAVKKNSLSRVDLLDARCISSGAVDIMSQQSKGFAEASTKPKRLLDNHVGMSQSTSNLSECGAINQQQVEPVPSLKKSSLRSFSSLSFRKSMIKLFC